MKRKLKRPITLAGSQVHERSALSARSVRSPYQSRPHYWSDCEMCGRMVVCGKCGNNSCNAGYGEVIGPEPGTMIPCDACPSAYEMQAKGEGGELNAPVDATDSEVA